MIESEEQSPVEKALRERISTLSTAILRISASLDMETVLQEAVHSARALTGARYGLIAALPGPGGPEYFVTSGLTEVEVEGLKALPYGHQFFEHLREVEGPVRLDDLHGYIRSLGYGPEVPASKTLQAMPMRHHGDYVGHFFLGEKEGGPTFGNEDEEVLELFASQAAAAIGNARTHRAEQRARADLEALVETTPVGVVVFDGRSGRVMSFNREVRRMAGLLGGPEGNAEGLLEQITCRRADGREVSLAEFPLSEQFSNLETVRAEEIVLSVPDGRSIETLVNVTPIVVAEGEAATVVVTMQDLAPLQELERLRSEFLGMVSHELRAPLTSIKGSAATALRSSRVIDPAETRQFFRIIEEQADHMDGLIGDLLDVGRIEAGTLSVDPEPSDVATLIDQARSTFVSSGSGHTVSIDLEADLPRVMADRQRIVQVLNNLLANAAREAPEGSTIRVAGVREGVHVAVSVSDEGRGMPPALMYQLFRKRAGLAMDSRDARTREWGWAWPSARGWWRRMEGVSVPRAPASAKARSSRLRSPWPRRPWPAARNLTGQAPAGREKDGKRRGSWWSTTIRRPFAMSAMRSSRQATPPS
ncbi:MAG: PAS domain-containing protein [Rhodospirillales bacterium]|nr:PAS domain-containing protein [Rhodospirillales bacterium]